MDRYKDIRIFSGNANRDLAYSISHFLELPLGKSLVKRFSDGEVWCEIEENVRGMEVFVVQPVSPPANENLMELLIMIDALKRASAETIAAVIPYYGYARQDRKISPRTPISAKLVADLLTTAGANRILSMDLHAGQIQGFFNIPVDNLYAMPAMIEYIQKNLFEDIVVVAPDAGAAERSRSYAKKLNVPMALVDKRRVRPNESEVMNIIGDVQNKVAVIIDDIIDTAGTLVQAAQAVQEKGAKEVYAFVTHPVLSGPALERIQQSCLRKLVVTNSISLRPETKNSEKIHVLDVAPLLGKAIQRIYRSESVSSLFI